MSEPTSAFAAYSSASNKKGASKSKKNQKANGVQSNNKSEAKAKTSKTTNKKEPTHPVVVKLSGLTAKGVPGATKKVNGASSKAKGASPKANGASPKANGAISKANGATSKVNGATSKSNGGTTKANGGTTKANGATAKAAAKAKIAVTKSTKANEAVIAPLIAKKEKGNATAAKKATSKAATNEMEKDAVALDYSFKSDENKKVKPLNDENLDDWVEELMTGTKKLNKEQQKRKKILKKFLMGAHTSDTMTASEIGDDDEEEEEEEEEEEFDEYTMNSYYDESTGDEESWSDLSDEDDVVDSEAEGADDDDTASETQNRPTQKTATKRKITDKNNSTDKVADCARTSQAIAELPIQKKARHTIGETVPLAAADKDRRHTIVNMTASIKEEQMSPTPAVTTNSIEDGKRALAWLLNPIDVNDFFRGYWEQKACYVRRNNENVFKHFISFNAIDEMLVNNHIEFTTNIDLTSYKNGVRETHNPEGRALPPVVWEHYGAGCSIRLLNPQTFMPNLCKLNAVLQEFFHCMVGANAYLTPPNSQGFAPHFDDIEAFVLQIEGRKRWRLYKPIDELDVLPRESSRNFKREEIGKPFYETVLMPGDILYFPRGIIHEASTEHGYHSLHITLSVYQKQSYADLMEKLMPLVLEQGIKRHLGLRRGLPLDIFKHLGLVQSLSSSQERNDLLEKVTTLAEKHLTVQSSLIDAAVDQLAKKYQHEALPPDLSNAEKVRTIRGSRTTIDDRGNCRCDYELRLTTNLRLLRANILRLVREDGCKYRVYFYVDNAREYCRYDPNYIEIEASEAGTIELLVRSYPAYVSISQFPIANDDRKLDVATALFERCLVMTEKPFSGKPL